MLNAAQARQLTNQSKPKIKETLISLYVPYINKQIEEAAKSGQSSINTKVHLNENVQEDTVNRLIKHYEDSGFKVDVRDFFYSKMFFISWDGEKE